MDYNFYKQILTFSILKLIFISLVCGKEGECRRKVRLENKYEDEIFCCATYEMINGTCIECKKGFISKDGGNCYQCTGNTYGTKCLQTCGCTEQTCHHVLGCIMVQFTGFQTTSKETEEEKRNEFNQDGVPFSQTKLHVIYSVCIAGLFVAMAICYICIHCLKVRRTEQTQERNNQQNEIRNAPNVSLTIHENIASVESIYDEIDEVDLQDGDLLPSRHSNVSDESNSDNTSESETENMQNDDYLNPYQPIVEDSDKHDYKTLNVSSNNLGRNEDTNIVHKGNDETPLENVNMHQYLDAIYPINKYITSSTTYGSSSHLQTKVKYSDIVNKHTYENLQPSDLYLRLINKDKQKEDNESVSSVPIKRLTI